MTAITAGAARRFATRPVPAWAVLTLLGTLGVALYLTVVPDDLAGWWYDAFGLIAAVVVAVHAIRTRAQVVSHLLLATALLLLGSGDVAFTILSYSEVEVFPSFADALYVSGGLLLGVALWHRYGRGGDVAVLIDSLIFMMSGALLLWEVVVEAIVADGTDLLSTAVALSYPAIDLLLIGLLARVALTPGAINGSVRLVMAAALAFLTCDIIYSSQLLGDGYVGGLLLDGGWLLGYALFAASVLHPSSSEPITRAAGGTINSRPRLLLLGTALLLAPLLAIREELLGDHDDVAVMGFGAIVLSILVISRLSIALRALRTSLDQRGRLQAELEHQANHDALTGLANRSLFTARLDATVSSGQPVAILFVDLDDFKAVNDSFGHEAGDRLLVEVGHRIQANLRSVDTAARLGGDEFAVMLDDVTDPRTAEATADRILAALRRPIDLDGQFVLARASIGICVSDNDSADGIMRDADIAMYLAKGQGKDRHQTFDAKMHADVLARLHVRADLERALDAREFVIHYQPIIDLETGRLKGTEALVRWEHPERGLVPPVEFIGIAETTGLIVPLGRWVLEEAMATTKRWQEELTLPDLTISVNVSPRQFEHPGFIHDVEAAIAGSDIRPENVTLEITESAIVDTEATAVMLGHLKRRGVRIAVDDFGTGYSSLSHVGRLPIDELKIDRAFVAALGTGTKEAALAASVIEIGAKLDLRTVAEGIEDWAQLELLRDLGCDLAQGYYFARPLAAGALEAFARSATAQARG